MSFYDILLAKKLAGGGGGSAVINPLSVSANGTYSAPEGVDGYNPVEVAVPMPSGTYSIGANGDYDIASYASAHVSVPTGVFPSGTSNITANGVYDVTNYESASVNVTATDTRFASLVARTIKSMVEGSDITNIGNYAFTQCTSITGVSFPNATGVGSFAFSSCENLTTVNLPNVTGMGSSAFCDCIKLSNVSMPKLAYIQRYAFMFCRVLSQLSLPAASTIHSSAFRGCYNLISLYLMGSRIPTLSDKSYCFESTPIGGYTTSTGGVYGSIFVPSSLYSQYIVANNWSNYAARFVSV